ncbi:DUF2339 domain-containing protein [Rhodococcus sp. X156]|uniref:DUF2339 domain-containing protein n=1 Tax=Rhodococcus sp. X156 TaxID=2499145 RepID=UPI000FDB2DB2|nr:DUF2339 domain-containing protein [Rhodococcus sp. X156]
MTQHPDHDDAVAQLADEVRSLRKRLDEVGAEPPQTPAPPTEPAPGRPGPSWAPVPPPAPVRPPQPAFRAGPLGPAPRPPQVAQLPSGPIPPAARGPRPPSGPPRPPAGPPPWSGSPPGYPPPSAPVAQPGWWARENTTSRVLAVAGSVITLLGVVMLLVLAVQNGFLGVVPRVVGGAVLATALLGLSFWVRNRPGGQIGSVTLAATGAVGLYLDVVVVTSTYHWVPVPVGLVLGFAITAAGLGIAYWWRSQLMALLAVLASCALSPFLIQDGGPELTGFVLAVCVAAGVLHLLRPWQGLYVVQTVAPVLAAAISIVVAADRDTLVWTTAGACVLVTVTGLVFALLAVHRDRTDSVAPGLLPLSVVPTLLTPTILSQWSAVAVVSGAAAVLIALRFSLPWLPRSVQMVLTGAGCVAAFEAMCLAATVESRASLMLTATIVLVVIAHQLRSRLALGLATGFGALGLAMLMELAPPELALSDSWASAHAGWPAVVAGTLLVVAAGALAYEVHWSRVLGADPISWLVGGAAMLYGASTALVAAGVLISPEHGYMGGHTAATVTWMIAALVLLSLGLSTTRQSLVARVAGLILAGSAVAKLLLFDLAAVSGIARVIGFIVVGLMLIAAGMRYARAIGSQPESQQQPGGPQVPSAHHLG